MHLLQTFSCYTHYLDEGINFEISFGGKLCDFASLQRLRNQGNDVFKKFTDNLGLNLDNIANKNLYLIVALGDLSVKSSKWYKQDKATYEG